MLSLQAEEKAVAAKDVGTAGWRVYHAGSIYYQRQQAADVLACADRAATYWQAAKAGAWEMAFAIRLRGNWHSLAGDYAAESAAYHEALTLWRTLSPESVDVASGLNDLAEAERGSGDYAAAERDYREALRIAKKVNHLESVAVCLGNLGYLALDREQWADAEQLAREALPVAEGVGRLECIAGACAILAHSLAQQDRKAEGFPYAQRAVAIYTKLRHRELAAAQAVLKECEEGNATNSNG